MPGNGKTEAPLCFTTKGDYDIGFFDLAGHRNVLARMASERLNQRDFIAAFAFSDRRCRLLKPSAQDFLLRSEASRLAGFPEYASEDLTRALELDPTDAFINQTALRRGAEAEKKAAASRLILDVTSQPETLRSALGVLRPEETGLLRNLRKRGDRMKGWVAWEPGAVLRMRIHRTTGDADHVLDPDAEHFLACEGWSAAEIEIEDTDGDLTGLSFFRAGRRLDGFAVAPVRMGPVRAKTASAAPEGREVTIIVPAYEDFEATRGCLESLYAQATERTTHLIVVDDCSPNADLRSYLQAEAFSRGFLLLRNSENLGFAASVNRALGHCPSGDILLVNADAWVPPDGLDRLAHAAHSAPGIGSVTPLSNNGEFTSFPEPNVANPLGAPSQILEIHGLAGKANGAGVVDLPNGIGFCLYIKRACLDAVGGFSELYSRGYFEDVEFCLRARERGFRNVCATGVYVGHAGSRSFLTSKRALVVRNLATLEGRFPGYRIECAAFLEANPLRGARGAIEARIPLRGDTALLVCPTGYARDVAQDRARDHLTGPDAPRALFLVYDAFADRVELTSSDEAGPRSLTYELGKPSQFAELKTYLGGLTLRRVEIFDVLSLPDALLGILFGGDAPVELVCGDLQWVYRALTPPDDPCGDAAVSGACEACLSKGFFSPPAGGEALTARQSRLRVALGRADAIRPADRMADAFARRVFKERAAAYDVAAPRRWASLEPARSGFALGVLAPAASWQVDRLIVRLAREFRKLGLETKIIVIGRCVDDLAVMAQGDVFVVGPVETKEYERVIRQYEIKALASPYRTRLFGGVDRLSAQAVMPKAYFDWSFGSLEREGRDLSLDPRTCDEKSAREIARWFAGLGREADPQ